MDHKPVTMKDVAAKAGVSISAVSHILNKNYHQVGPVKREQILAAIRELDYSPNAVARSMAKKSTSLIGLVLDDLNYSTMQRGVIRGVGQFLQTQDYYPMLIMAS